MESNNKKSTNTVKKTATTQKAKVEDKKAINLEQENEALKSEMSEMKKMLEQLMNDKKNVKEVQTQEDKDSLSYEEINPNRRVQITSLYNGMLSLTTQAKGTGRSYIFEKFGDSKLIKYEYLADMLEIYKRFAQIGYFYIDNKQVVANNDLTSEYEKLLNKKDILNLLTCDEKEMKDKFENTTNEQRQEIISWLLERARNNDEKIDLNRLNILKRIYTKKNNTGFLDGTESSNFF